MADDRFNWMSEEEDRAEQNVASGQTENSEAPILVKPVKKAPVRKTHGAYVQPKIWDKFEEVAFKMKREKGKPELLEEGLLYLIEKYSDK
ncbi:hypothetical protein [Vibrio campbellii]|uniref:hypothetical protein n=1 Tax=Vibrio campbellii TaxID=680 RepID=UPI0005F01040|nr:hypothetical protein [Vibrio campbellii]